MSPVMHEGYSYTYDYLTGKVAVDDSSTAMVNRFPYIIKCYFVTLVVEFIILALFGLAVCGKNLKAFLFINTATNIPLNAILSGITESSGDPYAIFLLWFFALEGIIMVVEALFYMSSLVDRENKPCKNKAFVYGVVANLCTAGLGYLLSIYLLEIKK